MLVHEWTKTIDVIPKNIVEQCLKAKNAESAMDFVLFAQQDWKPSLPLFGRGPFGSFEDSPFAVRHRKEEVQRRAKQAREEAVRRAAYEALSPEEKARVDHEAVINRMFLNGLVKRAVH